MTTPKEALTYISNARWNENADLDDICTMADRALASLEGDAVERVARIINQQAFDETYWMRGRMREQQYAKERARAILATGLVPDEINKMIYENKNDGFIGVCIGEYKTLEGEKGKVLQQLNTKVVHVYRNKWLNQVGYKE